MQVGASLMKRRDKSDAEASAPVSRQIGEARSLIVFMRWQIRISHHAYRHEKKCISKALNSAGESVMEVVRLWSECSVIPHRTRDNRIAEDDEMLWVDFARLDEPRHKRCEKSDNQCAGPQNQSGIGRRVS